MPTLRETEIKLLEGGQSRRVAIEKMRSVLSDIERCKQTLIELKVDIKKFQEKCKVAKVVGTTTSTTGAVLTTGISS